jgi:hypothetical protein
MYSKSKVVGVACFKEYVFSLGGVNTFIYAETAVPRVYSSVCRITDDGIFKNLSKAGSGIAGSNDVYSVLEVKVTLVLDGKVNLQKLKRSQEIYGSGG